MRPASPAARSAVDQPVPQRLLRGLLPGCDETVSGQQEFPGECVDALFPFVAAGGDADIGRVLVLEREVPEFVGGREPAASRWTVPSDDGDADAWIQQERGSGLHAFDDNHLQPRSAADGSHRSERLQAAAQTTAQLQCYVSWRFDVS
jgi:hypothetical protein